MSPFLYATIALAVGAAAYGYVRSDRVSTRREALEVAGVVGALWPLALALALLVAVGCLARDLLPSRG